MPLGAPVFLTMDRPEANGLWVAQDTGGAIKGANRFDTFWGAGAEATRIAGGMSANGQGADPAAQGQRGACARSALTKRHCGRGSPRRSARCRAGRSSRAEAVSDQPAQPDSRRRAAASAAPKAAAAAAAPRHDARRQLGPQLKAGAVEPDRILDLHGMNLDRAWSAIDRRSSRRLPRGDRVLLLITGHARPGDPPVQRGRIRAAVHDWLAVSRHAVADRRGARRPRPAWRRRQPVHHPAPPLSAAAPGRCTVC